MIKVTKQSSSKKGTKVTKQASSNQGPESLNSEALKRKKLQNSEALKRDYDHKKFEAQTRDQSHNIGKL